MSARVSIIGRIAKEPDSRYTPSGTAVFNCTIPVKDYMSKTGFDGKEKPCPNGWKESYNGKGYEVTQWWKVTMFGKPAETCMKYLDKGSWIYFEGRMSGTAQDGAMAPTVWEGKDGKTHASYEMIANKFEFVGGKSEGGERDGTDKSAQEDDDPVNNIPF